MELSKQNEQLQTRLSDMKVTLQENKAMMEEFMAGQAQAAPAPIAQANDEEGKVK